MGVESRFIWMDGEMVPFEDATVHVLSHTLHYGLGAFEGIRAYEQPDGRGGIWRLGAHLRRLLDSMNMTHLPVPYTVDELAEVCCEVLRVNDSDLNRMASVLLKNDLECSLREDP